MAMDDLTKVIMGAQFTAILAFALLWLKARRVNACDSCGVKAVMLGIMKIVFKLCERADMDCSDLWDELGEMQKGK